MRTLIKKNTLLCSIVLIVNSLTMYGLRGQSYSPREIEISIPYPDIPYGTEISAGHDEKNEYKEPKEPEVTTVSSRSALPSWFSLTPNLVVTVSTVAGSGTGGFLNGTGTSAQFNFPLAVEVDAFGNLFVADTNNDRIRKITPSGEVTTFAGSGGDGNSNGTGTSATFSFLYDLAFDSDGNLYASDSFNHSIRKISPSGVVTTFAGGGNAGSADGTGTQAQFSLPRGIAIDTNDNVYVADADNNRIRKISPNGVVSTLAGSGTPGLFDGTGISAQFDLPVGIAVDAAGVIYVTEEDNHTLRKISPAGAVTTLTGNGTAGSANGTGTNAQLNRPRDVVVDASGNLYVADESTHSIRLVDPNGVVTTLAGTGVSGLQNGSASTAQFKNPFGLTIDAGVLYVADANNHSIRSIENGVVASAPVFISATTIGFIENTTGIVYTAAATSDKTVTYSLRNSNDESLFSINGSTGTVVFLIAPDFENPMDSDGDNDYVVDVIATDSNGGNSVLRVTISVTNQNENPVFTSQPITEIDGAEEYTYIITTQDIDGDNISVSATNKPTWLNISSTSAVNVSDFAGSQQGFQGGTGTDALFSFPTGLAFDANGNLYVSEEGNHTIRKISPSGEVTVFAGNGNAGFTNGNGTNASFMSPAGLTFDNAGNLYVADLGNHSIRKITPSGEVSTLAGAGILGSMDGIGTNARFKTPSDVAVDASGIVYVADQGNHKIRRVTSTGEVTTIAGSGSAGTLNGTGVNSQFASPSGIEIDASGNLFIADRNNNLVRKISSTGVVSTLAGTGGHGTVDGDLSVAQFKFPHSLAFDIEGNLIVVDRTGHNLRKVTLEGEVTTLAGSGTAGNSNGSGTNAEFDTPFGVAVDAEGNLYVVDQNNHRIRQILVPEVRLSGNTTGQEGTHAVTLTATDSNGGTVTQSFNIVVNDVSPPVFSSSTMASFVEDNAGIVYTAEATDLNTITYGFGNINDESLFSIDSNNGEVFFLTAPDFENPTDGNTDNDYVLEIIATDTENNSANLEVTISVTNKNEEPVFTSQPVLAIDGGEEYKYFVTTEDVDDDNVAVSATVSPTWLSLNTRTEFITSDFAGSLQGFQGGTGTDALFSFPSGLAFDANGNLYVSEEGNHTIRKISPSGEVTAFAGNGSAGFTNGNGTNASFRSPAGLTFDNAGNLYVADLGNHSIRKITPSGEVSTLAGAGILGSMDGIGTNARFKTPSDVAVDASGIVYVADQGNHKIRRVTSTGEVTSIAGSGSAGTLNGTGVNSQFASPSGIEIDASGNLFIADRNNNLVRKISSTGVVSTLAGTGGHGTVDGDLSVAQFKFPHSLAFDIEGNLIVVDRTGHNLRKVTLEGEVTTLAGSGTAGNSNGSGTNAEFDTPFGVAVDTEGNLYVVDQNNHRIRQILVPEVRLSGNTTGQEGTHAVTLTATDSNGGTATQSFNIVVNDVSPPVFSSPASVSFAEDTQGIAYTVAATDFNTFSFSLGNTRDESLFNFNSSNGELSFLTIPDFENPTDGDADNAYVLDIIATDARSNSSQLQVTITVTNENEAPVFTSQPITLAGDNQDYEYNITVSDLDHDVLTVTATVKPSWLTVFSSAGDVVTTLAGSGIDGLSDGTGTAASFHNPSGIALDNQENVYVTDVGCHCIRKIDAQGIVTTFAGGVQGFQDGNGTDARFHNPKGLAADASGNLYLADQFNNSVRRITALGEVTTLAGGSPGSADGTGTSAQFLFPTGVAVDAQDNVYVADASNHLIRKISPAGVVTTLAGSIQGNLDGTGTAALFNEPADLVVDASGNLFVLEKRNHQIRKITPAGVVTRFAGGSQGNANGTGTLAQFHLPLGISIDGSGVLYVADESNHRVRRISQDGVVSTVAGASQGNSNGTGATARFKFPAGVAADSNGNLYVTDGGNRVVRYITAELLQLRGDPSGQIGNHAVTLVVTDPDGATDSQSFNVTVNDASAPVFSSPVAVSFAENSVANAYSTAATDLNTITYSLGTSNDENFFNINSTTGAITFLVVPDFENPLDGDSDNDYVLEIKATDGSNENTLTVTITVTDVDEIPPVFTSAAATNFAENGIGTAYTVVATDANSISYSLGTGNDEALFSISGDQVTFVNPPDFETPGDGDFDNRYVLEIKADDGLNEASQLVTITVTDVDEILPVFTSGTTGSLAENETGTAYLIVANDNNILTYSLGTNNEESLFNINANRVTFIDIPDFEVPSDNDGNNAYLIEVKASDGINEVSQLVTITVSDVNDVHPVFSSPGSASISENTAGTVYTAAASDEDTNVLIYSLGSTNDEAFFSINSANGEVTFVSPPDFENPVDGDANNVYTITVIASDGINETSLGVMITITDENDAPIFTSQPVLSVDDNAEYSYFITAVDQEGDVVQLSGSNLPGWLSVDLAPIGSPESIIGNGTSGFINGPGNNAQFNSPRDLTMDSQGNLYIIERGNHAIRKVSPDGVVTTFAGNGTAGFADGTGTDAQFFHPQGIASDVNDNIYVADSDNHRIRKITPGGVVSTLAGSGIGGYQDGSSAVAQFQHPFGIYVDASGNSFVADTFNGTVRKIDPSGNVTTVAGNGTFGYQDGTGTEARFSRLNRLTGDSAGNLYIVDSNNNRIRKVSPAGVVTTLAGSGGAGFVNGTGTMAQFNGPAGIALDELSGIIYVSDENNNRIRAISPIGEVTTFMGNGTAGFADGPGTTARFNIQKGIYLISPDILGIADDENNRIRLVHTRTHHLNGDATGQSGTKSITLTATDDRGAQRVQNFDITINDVTPPVITSPNTADFLENATGTITTVIASDSNPLIYSLGTGNDEGLFGITPITGLITFNNPPDFENPADANADNIYQIEVQASDGVNAASLTIHITVTDVIEDFTNPVFTSPMTVDFPENGTGTSYTIVATDNNALTYSLGTANDEPLFNLSSGVVTFITPPDFENPSDGDLDNSYVIEVKANDGLNESTQMVTITVTDVDEIDPVFTSLITADFSENALGTVYTVTATDANPLTYSLGTGNDEAFFNITGNNGEVTFINSPDFEAPGDGDVDNSYLIEVKANDGLNEVSQIVTIMVTDVDEILPVFTTSTSVGFAENSAGVVHSFQVNDANPLSFSLGTSGDESHFIMFTTGVGEGIVLFNTIPDFENPADGDMDNVYTLEIIADDGINSSSQTITVSVINLDDTDPVFVSGGAVDFAENNTGTAYTAIATDMNTLTYSLGASNDEAYFNIAGGAVSFKSVPDFESPLDGNSDNVYEVAILVSDGTNTVSKMITITVTDEDELAPVFTSALSVGFNEGSSGIAYNAVATDANSLTYTLGTGNDEALFSIFNTTGTGAVVFNDLPDFENPSDGNTDNIYVIEVIASDGTNSVSQTVTITVMDIDDTPAVFSVPLNYAENGTGIVYTGAANDANSVSYSLGVDLDESLFDIAAGAITFKNAPDFENPVDGNADNLYEVKLIATDAANTVCLILLITVTDELEDITPPIPPIITRITDDTGINNSDGITKDNTIIISGTAEANASLELYNAGNMLGSVPVDGSGNWNFDIRGFGLIEGTFNPTAQAVDPSGNRSAESTPFVIVIDFTAPVKPVITGISDDTGSSSTDGITSDRNLMVSGTSEPNALINLFANGQNVSSAQADGSGDWTVDASHVTLPAITFNFVARASDVAGNISGDSDPFSVSIDFTAPAKPVITGISDDTGSSSSDGITSDRNILVHGTAEAGVSVDIFSSGGKIGTVQADANGDWMLDISGFNLPEFTQNMTAEAIDPAGNRSALSDIFVLTIDFTAPIKPVITGISDDTGSGSTDGITSDRNLMVSGTSEPHALINLFANGQNVNSAQADGSGNWTVDASHVTLPAISFSFVAKATDIAGNASGDSDPFSVTIDFTGPTVSLSAPSGPTGGSFVVTAQFSEDVAGLTLGDITVATGTASNLVTIDAKTYTFSVSSGNNAADVTIAASLVTDIAGNANTGSNQVNLDFTAPAPVGVLENSLADFIKSEEISIYPNPAKDILNIDLSEISPEKVDITLINASGLAVFERAGFTEKALRLDVSGYTSGLYIVQFYDGITIIRKKVMVRK